MLVAATTAGCVDDEMAPDVVVPYPHVGDVATYEATGALVEIARWENAHAFVSGSARVRFALAESAPVLDGARSVHEAFLVTTSTSEVGGFIKHSERYVSPAHQATVQALYPISQDQSVLSFDERGYPWLFGASVLFGAEVSREPRHEFRLPDNLGRGRDMVLAWVVKGVEEVDGAPAWRLDLEGNASISGSVWFEAGNAWPVKATLTLHDDGLAPGVRSDGAYPASIEARRVELQQGGGASVPPRDHAARFVADAHATRLAWDGEAPPDGDAGYIAYPLGEAIRDAKLLDVTLQQWLDAADDPRVYRGTYGNKPGPAEGTDSPMWYVQFVDKDENYFEVEVERVQTPLAPLGAPRVNRSGPAEAPRDTAHGWFAAQDVPASFVPLSEGVRIMKDVFGAPDVQIFLRSLKEPAGYSYYIDGGFEVDGGRYTVVYAPNTGFIEEATGPVSVRFAAT